MMIFSIYKGISFIFGNKVYIVDFCCLVGDICIGVDSSIWYMVVVCGDVNYIVIGECINVQDGIVFYVICKFVFNLEGFFFFIGDDVIIGYMCMLYGCQFGNCILVGMGVIIMDGVVVQDDVFIGVGIFVLFNKILESGYLYVGNFMVQK